MLAMIQKCPWRSILLHHVLAWAGSEPNKIEDKNSGTTYYHDNKNLNGAQSQATLQVCCPTLQPLVGLIQPNSLQKQTCTLGSCCQVAPRSPPLGSSHLRPMRRHAPPQFKALSVSRTHSIPLCRPRLCSGSVVGMVAFSMEIGVLDSISDVLPFFAVT